MADLIEDCRRHRVMIGLLTVLGALLLGARAQQEEFRLEGSDVTLVPKYTGDPREIKWTLNDRILVEVILKPQEEITYNLTNDRAAINKTNGALTIRNLDTGDSGLYRAEVLTDIPEYTEIRLTVHDCPEQPTISVQSIEDQFVVSCESSSPDVTYEWFNPTRSVSKSQTYTEPKKSGILTCVVDNEVCNKNSSINFYIPAQPEKKLWEDDVTLVPQYTGDPSEIIWKVDGYKLVKMMLKPRVDKKFYLIQDRATISETDGSLTIRALKIWAYGNYTAVVLVNNDYYYTEIRLTLHRPHVLSGWFLVFIICVILFACAYFLWDCCCKNKKCRKEPSTQPKDSDIEGAEESESCITMKFGNDDTSQTDELHGLLKNPSKKIQSPRLILQGVQPVDHGIFTAETVLSDRKEVKFTDETDISAKMFVGRKTLDEPDTKIHVKELVWKKDGVTQFKLAASSLKLYTSNIKLEPGSVTVKNAEGKESYRVYFRLEEPPKSKSICSITFHPIKMTGKDQITWKKGRQLLNIEGDRIKCKPNGDLTINNVTPKDKDTYTVQCIDNELDQFILH